MGRPALRSCLALRRSALPSSTAAPPHIPAPGAAAEEPRCHRRPWRWLGRWLGPWRGLGVGLALAWHGLGVILAWAWVFANAATLLRNIYCDASMLSGFKHDEHTLAQTSVGPGPRAEVQGVQKLLSQGRMRCRCLGSCSTRLRPCAVANCSRAGACRRCNLFACLVLVGQRSQLAWDSACRPSTVPRRLHRSDMST